MEFKDVIKNRYSCKKYSDRQVEPEKLDYILEAGRLAPTAKNLQEQHIYVIQSPEMLAKVDALTPCGMARLPLLSSRLTVRMYSPIREENVIPVWKMPRLSQPTCFWQPQTQE